MAEWGKKTVNDDRNQLLWLIWENVFQLFNFRIISVWLKKPANSVVSEVSLLQCRRSCHSVQHPGRASELRVWSFSTCNSLKTDLKVSGFQSHQQQKIEVWRVLRNGTALRGLCSCFWKIAWSLSTLKIKAMKQLCKIKLKRIFLQRYYEKPQNKKKGLIVCL